MKDVFRITRIATAVLLIIGSTKGSAQDLPTTGRIETRFGKLELENGYPSAATVEKVFDDIDYQRACQAYLWALPLMAMEQWQNEHLSHRHVMLPRTVANGAAPNLAESLIGRAWPRSSTKPPQERS